MSGRGFCQFGRKDGRSPGSRYDARRMGLLKSPLACRLKELFNPRSHVRVGPPPRKLSDLHYRVKYSSGSKAPNVHIGQAKLALGEFEELVKVVAGGAGPHVVIYAGSSPCTMLQVILDKFPTVNFVLIDPAPANIKIDQDASRHVSHMRCDSSHIVYFTGVDSDRHSLADCIRYYNGGTPKVLSAADTGLPTPVAQLRDAFDSGARVVVFESYMTPELAGEIGEALAGHPSIHFWSDIRSKIGIVSQLSGNAASPTDADLLDNLALQYLCAGRLNPQRFFVKFRSCFGDISWQTLNAADCPYIDKAPELRMRELYRQRKFMYIGGDVCLQCWPGEDSAETRISTTWPAPLIEYDWTEYENTLYAYNMCDRWARRFHNPYADEPLMIALGLDHCADCSRAVAIIEEYREQVDATESVSDIIGRIFATCCSSGARLHRNGHGRTSPWTEAAYLEYLEGVNRRHAY